ncbi:MAG: hypothetical protein H7Z16_02830 [Pyrinomonadaceae bacterium]|nr:hypothetical protein [Pyrinomonadaceae bacterium]
MWLVSFTYALLLSTIPVIAMQTNDRHVMVFWASTPVGVRFLDQGKPNAWRGLVPLRSTRDEVERVLGAPTNSSHPHYFYDTEKEKVTVRYSADTCNRGSGADWDVPVNTVLTITVTPKAELLIKDLQLDLQNYARSEIAHPRGLVLYVSQEEGIGIESKLEDGCEVVMSVTYQPTTKDKELRCRNSKAAKG